MVSNLAIFDKEAINYDSWYSSKLGSFVDEVETSLAFRMFKAKEGMKILDIGCGTGNFSFKLAKMGCKVVGVDISDEMLSIAKEKAERDGIEIEFYNMDVYDLDFTDESFDAAFSMAAFESIREPERAINEIFRVVKEKGSILVGTINGESKWGELYRSEYFQKNSVFKYADFKNPEVFETIKPENLVKIGECLFIPPDSQEENINLEKEDELSRIERGGYICALWVK